MRFEPATFAEYDLPVPPGGLSPPDIYDPVDAVYAAARMLCANGAANGADIPGSVLACKHSEAYRRPGPLARPLLRPDRHPNRRAGDRAGDRARLGPRPGGDASHGSVPSVGPTVGLHPSP